MSNTRGARRREGEEAAAASREPVNQQELASDLANLLPNIQNFLEQTQRSSEGVLSEISSQNMITQQHNADMSIAINALSDQILSNQERLTNQLLQGQEHFSKALADEVSYTLRTSLEALQKALVDALPAPNVNLQEQKSGGNSRTTSPPLSLGDLEEEDGGSNNQPSLAEENDDDDEEDNPVLDVASSSLLDTSTLEDALKEKKSKGKLALLKAFKRFAWESGAEEHSKRSSAEVMEELKDQFHDIKNLEIFLPNSSPSFTDLVKTNRRLKKLRVMVFEQMKKAHPDVVQPYIKRYPNKVPPIDVMSKPPDLTEYWVAMETQALSAVIKQEPGTTTKTTPTEDSVEYKMKVFDYVWVRFSADETRRTNCQVLKIEGGKVLVRTKNAEPIWVKEEDAVLLMKASEYPNFVVSRSSDLFRIQNVRERKEAYVESTASEKEVAFVNPNHASSGTTKVIAVSELYPVELPPGNKTKWVRLALKVQKAFEKFMRDAPLKELPRWDLIFLEAIRVRFNKFLAPSVGARQASKYGEFFAFVQIIDTACNVKASVVDVLNWMENHVQTHLDIEDLKRDLEEQGQSPGESVDLYIARRIDNTSLLDKLYPNRRLDAYKSICKGLANPLVSNAILKWLEENKNKGDISIHELNNKLLDFNSSLGMIQTNIPPQIRPDGASVRSIEFGYPLPPTRDDMESYQDRPSVFRCSTGDQNNYDAYEGESQRRGEHKLEWEPEGDKKREAPPRGSAKSSHVSRKGREKLLNGMKLPIGKVFMVQKKSSPREWNDVNQLVDSLIEKHKKSGFIDTELGAQSSPIRKEYYARVLMGRASHAQMWTQSKKPVQREARNLNEVVTLAQNARKYLRDLQKEFEEADREGKIRLITKRDFPKLYLKKKFNFIGSKDPISANLPYWEQLRTIATCPNHAQGELLDRQVAENDNQQGQYVPPTPQDLEKIPTEFLKMCTRCSGNLHPYWLCCRTKMLRCGTCELGGHLSDRCPIFAYRKSVKFHSSTKSNAIKEVQECSDPSDSETDADESSVSSEEEAGLVPNQNCSNKFNEDF